MDAGVQKHLIFIGLTEGSADYSGRTWLPDDGIRSFLQAGGRRFETCTAHQPAEARPLFKWLTKLCARRGWRFPGRKRTAESGGQPAPDARRPAQSKRNITRDQRHD